MVVRPQEYPRPQALLAQCLPSLLCLQGGGTKLCQNHHPAREGNLQPFFLKGNSDKQFPFYDWMQPRGWPPGKEGERLGADYHAAHSASPSLPSALLTEDFLTFVIPEAIKCLVGSSVAR